MSKIHLTTKLLYIYQFGNGILFKPVVFFPSNNQLFQIGCYSKITISFENKLLCILIRNLDLYMLMAMTLVKRLNIIILLFHIFILRSSLLRNNRYTIPVHPYNAARVTLWLIIPNLIKEVPDTNSWNLFKKIPFDCSTFPLLLIVIFAEIVEY